MKNKLIVTTLSLLVLFSFSAQAQEEKKDNFAANKEEHLNLLKKEKAIIEATISCISSASTRDDFKKCHEQKKSSRESFKQEMESYRQQKISQRKEHLQNELKKLDEKSSTTKK